MPIAALGLFVVLSVESFKASTRYYYRRRSKRLGFHDLPTDSYGRPVNEFGKKLSKNQARALASHQKELERIRTNEREWRLEGERLPKYEETDSQSIREALQRPSTANSTRSASGRNAIRTTCSRTSSVMNSPPRARSCSLTGMIPSIASISGGGFVIRRNQSDLAAIQSRDHSTTDLAQPVSPPLSTCLIHDIPNDEIYDIFQNDGLDWKRSTWEGSPIYNENDQARYRTMLQAADS